MSRARYIGVRVVQTVFILWLVLTFLFFLFRSMPGSFTDIMLAQGADAESVAAFRARWGLDDPLHVQYFRYLVNFVRLDFGTSLQSGLPVLKEVRMNMFNTLILVAPGVTVAYLLGTGLGAIMGTNRGGLLERYGTIPVVVVGMMPEFFTAILLVVIFAQWLGLFPTFGMVDLEALSTDTWWKPYLTVSFLHHYILPFTAVVIRYLYFPTLLMRTSVVEVKGQDFIEYHRLTGLPKAKRLKHVGRHSILPVITAYPVSTVKAISGLVLIEIVFNWPGIGAELVSAVFARNFPVVQFIFFAAAAFVIVMNLVVDLLYGLIDPRVSLED